MRPRRIDVPSRHTLDSTNDHYSNRVDRETQTMKRRRQQQPLSTWTPSRLVAVVAGIAVLAGVRVMLRSANTSEVCVVDQWKHFSTHLFFFIMMWCRFSFSFFVSCHLDFFFFLGLTIIIIIIIITTRFCANDVCAHNNNNDTKLATMVMTQNGDLGWFGVGIPQQRTRGGLFALDYSCRCCIRRIGITQFPQYLIPSCLSPIPATVHFGHRHQGRNSHRIRAGPRSDPPSL